MNTPTRAFRKDNVLWLTVIVSYVVLEGNGVLEVEGETAPW